MWTLSAWALVLGLAPHPAEGAALGPASAAGDRPGPSRGDALLVDPGLVEALTRSGLAIDDARAVAARLSPRERAELSERLAELGTGGNPAVLLGVAAILAALVILVLELMGRRVISRP